MQIPQSLIQSLQGLGGFDEKLFMDVHQSTEQITSVRINPSKPIASDKNIFFEQGLSSAVPWCINGFYLSKRPSFTFDPLFHAGCYYVQEASSMFIEQALLQTVDFSHPVKALDLCAAPGGKSTHIQSLPSKDSLLVSNEAIRGRAKVLKDNIVKWGSANVLVTNNDPKDFKKLEGYFDIIVVDAPCSGSGLFRRDAAAVEEWSENNVALCSQRQQRIIADVLPALKENGVLIYSTCSYSKTENEHIVDWVCKEFEIESYRLQIQPGWNITEIETEANNHCYRFWPYLVKGEGFFLSAFKKRSHTKEVAPTKFHTKIISKKEEGFISRWVNMEQQKLVSFGGKIYVWQEKLFPDFDFLAQQLTVIYSGVLAGELVRDKLIPEHALAMRSALLNDNFPRVELDKENAIAYLQRKDFAVKETEKGWQLACYQNHPLGWMNVLQNRINNYYPKELKILKEKE